MKKNLASVGKAILIVGMFLYLGKHSLNFFGFTFKGDDVIYSYLGLLTTSGGVLIWLAAFLWLADSMLEKTVAFVMLLVSLVGEFAVAGFDMYMNATGGLEGKSFTSQELHTMIYVVAGLALLHSFALVIDMIGEEVVRVWNDIPKKVTTPAVPASKGTPFLVPPAHNAPVNKDGGGDFTA